MPAKKSKGSSDEEKVVLDYLVKANRPYSANDISSQLHGKVSPAQAKKILNDLADDGRIQRKVNGKQQIFYPNQSDIDVPSIEEAEEEAEKIKELEDQVETLKSENKVLASRLQGLNNALTDDQMRERIAKLSNEIKENDERLEHLRSGEVISPEEKSKIETEHATMVKHWKARKRMFKNVSDAIAEGYPGKIKDLFAEIGIETDEDAGADISIIAAK
ncbi:PSMC3 interacting protein [Coemansia sp. RSA 1813]|nr:PSMC3 interacting protein [Coemansia sp. RSA 1646]KAJ1769552.1 PSMC3 interacting protein [Coemansia sp. RSA 1843]KAJ2090492.1 PSMC3 interacting protein [Coemansia sp. RSA 986]KAJ2212233.1 PSMC3 interacting protein [Coemansia sp. RSA 487]KAJ2570045.1 PSMC3 interacting protein [Coemansia sp. RSA 1813]